LLTSDAPFAIFIGTFAAEDESHVLLRYAALSGPG
jgi:hypothetical protein